MGDERFTVSTVGMAALHAGRAPWMLPNAAALRAALAACREEE